MTDDPQRTGVEHAPSEPPPTIGAILTATAIAAGMSGAIAGAISASFNLPLSLAAIPFIIAYKLLGGPIQPFLALIVAMLIGLIVVKFSLMAIEHAREQAHVSPENQSAIAFCPLTTLAVSALPISLNTKSF